MKKTKVIYEGASEEPLNSKIKKLESDGWEIADLKFADTEFQHVLITAHKKEKKVDDILTLKGKSVEIWEFCKEERDSESCLEGTCPLECYCKNNQIQDLEFNYNDKKDIRKIEEIYEWMKKWIKMHKEI